MSDANILAQYPVLQFAVVVTTFAVAVFAVWRGESGAKRARAAAQQVPDETMVYWGGPNAKMLELLQSINSTLLLLREDLARVARDQKDAQEMRTQILRDIKDGIRDWRR